MRPLIILLFVAGSPAAADLTRLSWMSGCWAYDGKELGSGEYWMRPIAGSMLAVSRAVEDGHTVGFEYLRIAEVDETSVALFASPSGKPAVRFELVKMSDNSVTFENIEHDFPQRIIYSLSEGGALLGRIEGESDGSPVAIDFPMTSVDCKAFGL